MVLTTHFNSTRNHISWHCKDSIICRRPGLDQPLNIHKPSFDLLWKESGKSSLDIMQSKIDNGTDCNWHHVPLQPYQQKRLSNSSYTNPPHTFFLHRKLHAPAFISSLPPLPSWTTSSPGSIAAWNVEAPVEPPAREGNMCMRCADVP